MKIVREERVFEKLGHAKLGDVVSLVDPLMDTDDETYIVCADSSTGNAARSGLSHGLYDSEQHLFLVCLSTGCAKKMPLLSSRAVIYRHSEILLKKTRSAP